MLEYANYTRSYMKIISEQLRDLTNITDFINCDHPTTFFKISEYFRSNHSLYGLGHRGKRYNLKSKSIAKARCIFSIRPIYLTRESAILNGFIILSMSRKEGKPLAEISRMYTRRKSVL